MSKRPWYDRRDSSMKLEEIDAMIRAENEPEKRNVLLVLQCLTSNLASNTRLLEEMEEKLHNRITKQASILEEQKEELSNYHDLTIQAKTGWKIFTSVVGILQAFIFTVGVYGYNLIAKLQTTVNTQSVVLPELQKKLEASNATLNRLVEVTYNYYKKDTALELQDTNLKELISQALTDLDLKDDKLARLSKEISRLKSKKVIRQSK